jgi:hypothetical protein
VIQRRKWAVSLGDSISFLFMEKGCRGRVTGCWGRAQLAVSLPG